MKIGAVVILIVLISAVTTLALRGTNAGASPTIITSFLNIIAIITTTLFAGHKAEQAKNKVEEVKQILNKEGKHDGTE